jgi:Na+/H+ antiporter NhaA
MEWSDSMARTPTSKRVAGALQDFLHDEAAGGIVLVVGAVVAVVWANSPVSDSYVFWKTMTAAATE